MTPDVIARSEAVYHLANQLPADRLRPATHARLRDALAHWFDPRAPLTPGRRTVLEAALDTGEGDLAACPEVAELGYLLLDPSSDVSVRIFGCKVLAHAPTAETMRRLAAVLADGEAPVELRNQAAWTLGFRQLQTRHPALHITADAVAIADDALRAAVDAGLCATLADLAEACRHVADPTFHDRLVDRPLLAAEMVDGHCSPALAAVLLDQLPTLPPARRPRVVRVVAATLGAGCVDALLARTEASDVATRQEALKAAFAISPERAGAALDGYNAGLAVPAAVAARRALVARHPGRHPLVDVVALARTSACVAPDARVERFAPLLPVLREAHAARALDGDQLLRTCWVYLAYACRAARPAELAHAVAAQPEIVTTRDNLPRAYLASLAAAGKYHELADAGGRLGLRDAAGWHLARAARPFLALRTTLDAKRPSALRIAAETIALTFAGRPDLAARTLQHVEPEAEFLFGDWSRERFPGPAERFDVAAGGAAAQAITAVAARDRDALLGSVAPPVAGGDRDELDFVLLRRFEAPRGADLTGARVVIVGTVDAARRAAIAAALATRGAELLDAPFGDIDRFIVGEEPAPDVLHRLFKASARPLGADQLGLAEDA